MPSDCGDILRLYRHSLYKDPSDRILEIAYTIRIAII